MISGSYFTYVNILLKVEELMGWNWEALMLLFLLHMMDLAFIWYEYTLISSLQLLKYSVPVYNTFSSLISGCPREGTSVWCGVWIMGSIWDVPPWAPLKVFIDLSPKTKMGALYVAVFTMKGLENLSLIGSCRSTNILLGNCCWSWQQHISYYSCLKFSLCWVRTAICLTLYRTYENVGHLFAMFDIFWPWNFLSPFYCSIALVNLGLEPTFFVIDLIFDIT